MQVDDHHAYSELFHRYNKLLYSHAYNKLRNEAESRDIIQDVFIQLWEKRFTIQPTNLIGLLFTMVRNKIINLVSHQSVAEKYNDAVRGFMKSDYSGADHLIREKQLADIISAEIAALPPRMREVFELSRFEHLSNKEIAERLELSEHTVATQIKKSLRVLRYKIGLAILITLIFGR